MARRAFSKEALGGLAFASLPQAENVLALPKRGRVTKPQPPKRPRPKVAPRPKPIVELDSRLAKVSAKMRVHKAVPIHLTVDDYREVVAFCEARELRLTAALQVLVRSGLAAEAGAVLAETFAPATTPLSGFRELARAADSRNGFVLPTEQEARAAERERAVAPLRRVAAMDDLAEHLRGMLPASVDPGRHRYPAVPATPPEARIDPEAEPAAADSPQEESVDA